MRITLSEAEASTILSLLQAERTKARRTYTSDVFTNPSDTEGKLRNATHLLDLTFLMEKLEAHRG